MKERDVPVRGMDDGFEFEYGVWVRMELKEDPGMVVVEQRTGEREFSMGRLERERETQREL